MALLDSPAAERNKEPIADVLAEVLPARGIVLEIASGSGQHASHFAARFPQLSFWPSDPREDARASIETRRLQEGLPNLRSPAAIDVLDPRWPDAVGGAEIAAVVCINMIHIAPWEATAGLFEGAARLLLAGAPCITYGPYRFGGRFLAESNAAFDASLRARDARWGVRDLDDVTREAAANGFERERVVDMPANNHTVVFRRRTG